MVAGRSRHADFSGLSRAISLQPGEQVATTCQNRNWKTKPHSINFQLDRRVSLVKGILVGDDEAAGNDMEPVDEACCEAVAVADEVEALRPLIPSCPPPPPPPPLCWCALHCCASLCHVSLCPPAVPLCPVPVSFAQDMSAFNKELSAGNNLIGQFNRILWLARRGPMQRNLKLGQQQSIDDKDGDGLEGGGRVYAP